MPVTVSTATMVEQLSGLLHTRDVTIREADYEAELLAFLAEVEAETEELRNYRREP